jgi:hypothetical protein
MLKNRNHSLISFPESCSIKSRRNSIIHLKPLQLENQLPPKPLSSLMFKPRPKSYFFIPKLSKAYNSVEKLVDCTNKLMRKYTNMGPGIDFSSKSSINKLHNYKVIEKGVGITLKLLANKNKRKTSLFSRKIFASRMQPNENIFN